MISDEDCKHLKLLYEQFLKMNSYINTLILSSKWEEVDIAIQQKNYMQKQILLFEKPRLKDVKNNPELDKTRKHLIELETQNLKLVQNLFEKTQNELQDTKRIRKLLNTYEPQLNNSKSTFEINDEE